MVKVVFVSILRWALYKRDGQYKRVREFNLYHRLEEDDPRRDEKMEALMNCHLREVGYPEVDGIISSWSSASIGTSSISGATLENLGDVMFEISKTTKEYADGYWEYWEWDMATDSTDMLGFGQLEEHEIFDCLREAERREEGRLGEDEQ